jgi:hypothetical protein
LNLAAEGRVLSWHRYPSYRYVPSLLHAYPNGWQPRPKSMLDSDLRSGIFTSNFQFARLL